ncbi:hypothetical protein ABC733_01725 [Mangrovibacter sp. SLW1]
MKFTAPDDNPVSERWRDLLLAEHLALGVLGVQTEVFDFAGQRFLEIPRFDRVGLLGRVGVISLRALDAEFVGKARSPGLCWSKTWFMRGMSTHKHFLPLPGYGHLGG